MFHKTLAQGFFIFSVLAGLMAAYGWAMRHDIWLASTQWVEIAIYLLLIAIYVRISEADDVEELKARARKKLAVRGRAGQSKKKTGRAKRK